MYAAYKIPVSHASAMHEVWVHADDADAADHADADADDASAFRGDSRGLSSDSKAYDGRTYSVFVIVTSFRAQFLVSCSGRQVDPIARPLPRGDENLCSCTAFISYIYNK